MGKKKQETPKDKIEKLANEFEGNPETEDLAIVLFACSLIQIGPLRFRYANLAYMRISLFSTLPSSGSNIDRQVSAFGDISSECQPRFHKYLYPFSESLFSRQNRGWEKSVWSHSLVQSIRTHNFRILVFIRRIMLMAKALRWKDAIPKVQSKFQPLFGILFSCSIVRGWNR